MKHHENQEAEQYQVEHRVEVEQHRVEVEVEVEVEQQWLYPQQPQLPPATQRHTWPAPSPTTTVTPPLRISSERWRTRPLRMPHTARDCVQSKWISWLFSHLISYLLYRYRDNSGAAVCKDFTYFNFRGIETCFLLTGCNDKRPKCTVPDSCVSGKTSCTELSVCNKLTRTPGMMRWRCQGGINPYTEDIPVGTPCYT